jgi:hypothetical protein
VSDVIPAPGWRVTKVDGRGDQGRAEIEIRVESSDDEEIRVEARLRDGVLVRQVDHRD